MANAEQILTQILAARDPNPPSLREQFEKRAEQYFSDYENQTGSFPDDAAQNKIIDMVMGDFNKKHGEAWRNTLSNEMYASDPLTITKTSKVVAPFDMAPADEYRLESGMIPTGDERWSMPQLRETQILQGASEGSPGWPVRQSRTQFYPDVPLYSPGSGEMQAEPMAGGGFDFGGSELNMGEAPAAERMAQIVAASIPENTSIVPGSDPVPFPRYDIDRAPMTQERWARFMMNR